MIHGARRVHLPFTVVLGAVLAAIMTLFMPAQGSLARNGHGLEGVVDGCNLNDFNGLGRIDRFKEDLIVIDDCQKRLSSNVKFYRKGRKRINRSRFRVGSQVGYMTNSKGEIISLWLIRPSGKRFQPGPRKPLPLHRSSLPDNPGPRPLVPPQDPEQ